LSDISALFLQPAREAATSSGMTKCRGFAFFVRLRRFEGESWWKPYAGL